MWGITKWIQAHPNVSTAIIIITIIGFIITIIALVLQIKDKKRKSIFYNITSNTLINNEISGIEGIKVLFAEEEVKTIVVSTVKLWNSGNEYIESSDFYDENPLKFTIPKTDKILAAAFVEEPDKACQFQINLSTNIQNEALISFYCFEPHQSARINIYHTCTDEKALNLEGRIKGGKIANSAIEMDTQNGEMCISTHKYKIYLNNRGILSRFFNYDYYYNRLGISIVKKQDKRKK